MEGVIVFVIRQPEGLGVISGPETFTPEPAILHPRNWNELCIASPDDQ